LPRNRCIVSGSLLSHVSMPVNSGAVFPLAGVAAMTLLSTAERAVNAAATARVLIRVSMSESVQRVEIRGNECVSERVEPGMDRGGGEDRHPAGRHDGI